MRRTDKEIASREEIEAIIRRSTVCRLGLVDEGRPYIVPLAFGYKGNALYFHSAPIGRKMEILRRNPEVCFELDTDAEPVPAGAACGWTMRYRSVIGYGTVSFLESIAEKKTALSFIMGKYTNGAFEFPDESVREIAVFRLEIREMVGKKSGHKSE